MSVARRSVAVADQHFHPARAEASVITVTIIKWP